MLSHWCQEVTQTWFPFHSPRAPKKCELSCGDRPHRVERLTSKGQLAGIESLPAEFAQNYLIFCFLCTLSTFLFTTRQTKAGQRAPRSLYFLLSLLCSPPFSIIYIMTGKDKERHAYSWGTSLRGHYSSSGAATHIAITHGSRKDAFTARQTDRNAIFLDKYIWIRHLFFFYPVPYYYYYYYYTVRQRRSAPNFCCLNVVWWEKNGCESRTERITSHTHRWTFCPYVIRVEEGNELGNINRKEWPCRMGENYFFHLWVSALVIKRIRLPHCVPAAGRSE